MIALPPVLVGAVKATLALALPAVALTLVGAPGTVSGAAGVTFNVLLAVLEPTALTAVTLQPYCVPLVRPVTLIGLTVPLAVFVLAAPPPLVGEQAAE